MKTLRRFIATSVMALSALASHAGVVASNPWNAAATDAGAFSQAGQQLASQFQLAAGASIDRATWHGTMFSADPLNTGDTWSFSINIYADAAGLPAALIGTANVMAGVTDTGINIGIERDYIFDATFAGINLGSGSYFLSILNTGTQNTFRWTEGTGAVAAARFSGGVWIPWTESGRVPPNYTLYSDGQRVPEPGTLALAGLALAALALGRRRA